MPTNTTQQRFLRNLIYLTVVLSRHSSPKHVTSPFQFNMGAHSLKRKCHSVFLSAFKCILGRHVFLRAFKCILGRHVFLSPFKCILGRHVFLSAFKCILGRRAPKVHTILKIFAFQTC